MTGNVLQFYWIQKKDPSAIKVLIFRQALFGLVQSSFVLAGNLRLYLEKLRERYPVEVEEIVRIYMSMMSS